MGFSQELQVLLDGVIDSLVKWDLIAYLQKNPNDRRSAENIAGSIGRSVDEVMQALSELSDRGILQYEDDGEAIYYRFHPSKQWQKHINAFTEGLADRNTRWLILNYLIEKHGFQQG
ncbi:MAG: hypothetical protein COW32_05035 [Candidatus Aquicultor secundus]|uniref:Uncharacterized protein n=1 Tax=Candidatus Aquicultor secundus TaxID=1973895 RepID=A0A2M7T686_9ACTN|nr:hypothetical protein [Candidatus Aquicultor secundus]NCO65523.1 hypothetical protein [Solirubrobacter sp.]OIO83934.1 MAG: hypothetical protein AUK32_09185 [Candidatus Aquicultor secundus]PIU26285.1 MAG: hypothetical protein COT10_09390 [Candidatus Aquicultor secundus]PIW22341.1 MAG: hypothetical protein COW32_05035 [Candidatus Aquicultor secundus]PIY37649.1 MAG: hypothetical protein COZ03_09780 [Candidatus Aquicultor secundus]